MTTNQYLINDKLKNLSDRIASITDKNSSYCDGSNTSIIEEELKYNISSAIAKLLLGFPLLPSARPEEFSEIISNYNKANRKKFSIKDFSSLGFIRIISGKVRIPSTVRSALWSLENKDQYEIPKEFSHHFQCLLNLHKQISKERSTASKKAIDKYMSTSEVELLIDKEILKSEADTFLWNGGEYSRHLRNEITAKLWISILQDEKFCTDKDRLLLLCSIILDFDINWPDQLERLLSVSKLRTITKESFGILLSEEDLIDNGLEFRKSWLDSRRYLDKSAVRPIPEIQISKPTVYDTLRQIKELEKQYHLEFGHDETRDLYQLLIRFIITLGHLEEKKYNSLKTTLSDTKRPFLVASVYWNLRSRFHQVVPFLLVQDGLAPLVFMILDNVEIANQAVKNEESDEHPKINQTLIKKKKLSTQIWCEVFEFWIRMISANEHQLTDQSWSIYNTLLLQIEKFYAYPVSHPNDQINHEEARKRFEFGFKLLQEVRFHGNYTGIKPRMFPWIIQTFFEELQKRIVISWTKQRQLDKSGIEFAIQVFKLEKVLTFNGEVPKQVLEKNKGIEKNISTFLYEALDNFFNKKRISGFDHKSGSIKQISAKWGLLYPFAFDVLDWGYCLAVLHKFNLYNKFKKAFYKQVKFNVKGSGGIYEDENNDQYTRIRLLLKSLSYGIIQIQKDKTRLHLWGLETDKLLDTLYSDLENMAIRFCIDDLKADRINTFNERYHFESRRLHYNSLTQVVFNAFNYRTDDENLPFLKDFIGKNSNLELLLTISHALKSNDAHSIISDEIKRISLDEFINSSSSTNNWKEAMIDSINSTHHFKLAAPLLNKLEAHYEKVSLKDENDERIFYEVKLLYAFRNKDLEAINKVSPPKNPYTASHYNQPIYDKKNFFIGLHQLYNENDYPAAIKIFEELISKSPADFEYNYRLFHAKTMQSINESDDLGIAEAFETWQKYLSDNKEDSNKTKSLQSMVSLTSIHYYLSISQYPEVDRFLLEEPEEYRYAEEIVQSVFDMYNKRDLPFKGPEYLRRGFDFHKNNSNKAPEVFERLLATIDTTEEVATLKLAFLEIRDLPPEKIIHTVPQSLNGQITLDLFILHELINAGKIVLTKYKALDKIEYEDKYNDLLQSTLRLRFPIWGWDIPDQERTGNSNSKGLDLGSSDFKIKTTGTDIALVEAMILDSKNREKTEEHVVKCFKYISYIRFYFIITYFKGKDSNFYNVWDAYKEDVLKINYDDTYKLKLTEFTDLSSSLTLIRNIKVGKTQHVDDIAMYHIFFNIPDPTS
ncbi:MAG: hypothetical protein ABJG78_12710 [Cyclobacteriaceae bacterium]